MGDDATALRALLDREEIRELGLRYCHYMWQKDMRVVDLFTEDGGYGDRLGVQARMEMYANAFQGASYPHPYANNHVIDFESADHATGFCYNDLRFRQDGQWMIIAGFWHDEYVRVDGAWKFKHRQFTSHFSIPESDRWLPAGDQGRRAAVDQ